MQPSVGSHVWPAEPVAPHSELSGVNRQSPWTHVSTVHETLSLQWLFEQHSAQLDPPQHTRPAPQSIASYTHCPLLQFAS
jgi:hypothetical protein